MKSEKMPYIIYTDIESLIRKMDKCANDPKNYSTTIAGDHIPWECSMSTIWAFDHIEIKHTLYCGNHLWKNLLNL